MVELRRTTASTVAILVALAGIPLVELAAELRLGGDGLLALAVRDLLVKWAFAVAIVAVVVRVERRSLSSVGVARPGWGDIGAAVLVFVLGAVSYPFTTPLLRSFGFETTVGGIERLATYPPAFVLALALTAALTEELLYRGYPIERIAERTGSTAVAAGVTVLCFVVFHVPYWGVGGTLQIGVNAVLLTLLYVWRRNLVACVLSHAITDVYAFIVVPRYLSQYL
ncbi:CPBP family intramembrane glutamic endopeptidase [Halorubrum aethiopicum]|uniref:CPBP family intramembrane glutamic endopeptidase n=1 Tax=Halorubrum aethiopicum TaxID=1758255 RepID=UPI00082D81D0|nr:CPBP family intramembrane glutamic endopeptidase [Halorubrum aethiopicum]